MAGRNGGGFAFPLPLAEAAGELLRREGVHSDRRRDRRLGPLQRRPLGLADDPLPGGFSGVLDLALGEAAADGPRG